MIEIKLPEHISAVKARSWCKRKIGPSAWYKPLATNSPNDHNFWTGEDGAWRLRSKPVKDEKFTYRQAQDWYIYFLNEQDATLFSLEML